jgi:hypothetical protein
MCIDSCSGIDADTVLFCKVSRSRAPQLGHSSFTVDFEFLMWYYSLVS